MPQRDVKRLTRVALVLEVLVPPAGADLTFVQVVESIPGREGTITRTWDLPEKRLTDASWLDMQAWLIGSINTCLEVLGGSYPKLL